MAKRHICDETCVMIIRERLEKQCPPHWNAMREEDQKAFLSHDHLRAYAVVHGLLSPARRTQWAVMRFFGRLYTAKAKKRLGIGQCPTCGTRMT